jgi:hypothetical protein
MGKQLEQLVLLQIEVFESQGQSPQHPVEQNPRLKANNFVPRCVAGLTATEVGRISRKLVSEYADDNFDQVPTDSGGHFSRPSSRFAEDTLLENRLLCCRCIPAQTAHHVL